jgi:hypothetical protein
MKTQFVDLDMAYSPPAQNLPHQVEKALQQWGEPLRWAITRVDTDQQTVHIEAIITIKSP